MSPPTETGALDRHEQRRAAGLPTVSVLAGPLGLAVHAGRRWADQVGRPTVQLASPDFVTVLDSWVDHLATGRDLARDAVAWLAAHSGRPVPAAELAARVGRMTRHELSALLDSIQVETSPGDAGAACRWLLERQGRGEPLDGRGLAARMGATLFGSEGAEARERAAFALGDLIPPPAAPVLLLARGDDRAEPAAWVESAARTLARLALARPALATILAVAPADLDTYTRAAPESRAKALVRAGVIAVRGVDADEIARRLAAAVPGATARLRDSARRLAADGAPDDLVRLFLDAARAGAAPPCPDAGPDDPARSAAERFLFERLESLPATAGLFRLNAALDLKFGPSRAMEVDLFSDALGLAVEIDGYYHFQNLDAYRRDRRKDLELQKRGHLVVRVLAEDVVARLEEVLGVIQGAVASRGGRDGRQQSETS